MQTLSYLSSVSQKAASFTAFYFHKILFIYHNKILQCFGYGQCLFEILSKEPYLVFVFFFPLFKQYGTLHEFACYPCAGAVFIFSAKRARF